MKILYLDKGLENESTYADGWFVVKALTELGHVVRSPQSLSGLSKLNDFDLVLIIRGEHHKASILRSKGYTGKIALWNWEPPGMPYLDYHELQEYDYIFNSSKANNKWVSNRTRKPCTWLTQPVDTSILKRIPVAKKVYNIIYAGTYSPLRWNWLWEIRKHFSVRVIGSGWLGNMSLGNLTGKDFNEACNKADVALVLPSWASPNFKGTDIKGKHYSLRNMMYLATGTFVVSPKNKDFDELFTNYAYLDYTDLEGCISALKMALDRDLVNERNKLLLGAWQEIQDKYTYKKTMERMLNDISNM